MVDPTSRLRMMACWVQARRAVCAFRAQMALIRLQVEVCEPDEVMQLVMEAIELEDYIISGAFSKQGDPLERWDRVKLLLVSAALPFEPSSPCHEGARHRLAPCSVLCSRLDQCRSVLPGKARLCDGGRLHADCSPSACLHVQSAMLGQPSTDLSSHLHHPLRIHQRLVLSMAGPAL